MWMLGSVYQFLPSCGTLPFNSHRCVFALTILNKIYFILKYGYVLWIYMVLKLPVKLLQTSTCCPVLLTLTSCGSSTSQALSTWELTGLNLRSSAWKSLCSAAQLLLLPNRSWPAMVYSSASCSLSRKPQSGMAFLSDYPLLWNTFANTCESFLYGILLGI